MKDNGYYKIQDGSGDSKLITLKAGCIVDYEILIREIFGSTILQHQFVEVEKPKHSWLERDDRIKINRTMVIEIKVVRKPQNRKLRAFK
ncbi:hypothetical protein [Chryseobacterium flavum]|uniref:hypothetical protein n=1 Tax=Chryseobacterium flavum TaxID=415851 RepID=UPI0028A6423F|nr:hypothetical protein [Chryseobacterium flavum]